MITTRSYLDQVWTDLNSPTKEEVDSLLLTQNVTPIIAKDLQTPTPSQHAEKENGVIYAVLHLPAFKLSHTKDTVQEIDFVIGAKSLITARYDSIDALHLFAKQIEVCDILNKGGESHIFFGMIKEIYKSLDDELCYMEDWMKEVEKNIFEGQEKKMVFAISSASRNLLNFRRVLDPHGNIFEFLREAGRENFGEKFETSAKHLIEEWRRIMRRLNNQIDLIIELRETNNSLLSTKQNEIMKNLAIIGSVMLPLTVIGQIFGLSVLYFPLKNDPNAFWIILTIMVIVMFSSLAFTRIKKWM